jgi:CheY-like chemotaxis protein
MPASEEKKLPRPAQILLVEDNRTDAELTLGVFRQARLSNAVHVARTGIEALDYILGRGEFANRERHPLPDLVLLHLKTPLVSGNQVLREIKSQPRLARIPVVILTSSKEEGEARWATTSAPTVTWSNRLHSAICWRWRGRSRTTR